MARPRKLRRDPEKPARTFSELQALYDTAERLYLLTGGESIDLQIDALDYTQRAYRSQMSYAEREGEDQNPWGPTVTPYESRMTAGTHAKLQKLREQKMQQCLLWAEEGAEAAAERKGTAGVASASSPMAAAPETSVEAQAETTSAPNVLFQPEAGEPANVAADKAKAAIGGTPMPLGRGQSQLEPDAHVFVDAPVALPAAGLTNRIAQMLSNLPDLKAIRRDS